MILMRFVRNQCPHGIMYGVNIADGIIVSCDNMQQCLVLGIPPAEQAGPEPAFDDHWQALEAVCKDIGTGRLAEVQFTDGQPVKAKTTPRGRRFRYFVNA